MKMPVHKYRPSPAPSLPDRTWPSKTISRAPRWCSVDLRDGNQALVIPMSVEEKLALFTLLVDRGFKEIEVGFLSASRTEYDFLRLLIEEGTLFGNGERTGNVDLVTLAMNMFSQGVDPGLDLSDITKVIETYERCTKMTVPARHPYAGELVYTAFSGSHQDAINKGMRAYREARAAGGPQHWEVPYLPIDPADVGRTFESVIRINSQSGKGGIAYVMEKEFGFTLPKAMHPEFGHIIQTVSEQQGGEVLPRMMREVFERVYLQAVTPLALHTCRVEERAGEDGSLCGTTDIRGVVTVNGEERTVTGRGNGPIDAFSNGLKQALGFGFTLLAYHEHALERGSDAQAAAYIQIEDGSGAACWGAGVDTNIDRASFRALLSALNRSRAADRSTS